MTCFAVVGHIRGPFCKHVLKSWDADISYPPCVKNLFAICFELFVTLLHLFPFCVFFLMFSGHQACETVVVLRRLKVSKVDMLCTVIVGSLF